MVIIALSESYSCKISGHCDKDISVDSGSYWAHSIFLLTFILHGIFDIQSRYNEIFG